MSQTSMRMSCAGAALACLLLTGGTVRAETVVDGDRSALNVTASNASVEDVLKALGDKFDLHYRSNEPLERRLNGVYSGSLQRLLADVLTGYDYFIVWGGAEQIEVVVLGSAQTKPAAVNMTVARTNRRSD